LRSLASLPFIRLLVFAPLAVLALACSEPPPAENAAAEAEEPSLLSKLGEHERKIRAIPGRTGILAEQKRYSLFDEELIIRDFFQDRKGGVFLDVGCAWPIDANNTYYLEKHLAWTGIGVDALSDYAEAWQRERPGSRFFSFLVTDRSGGTGTFFKSPNPGLSSTDRSSASGKNFGETMEPEKIEIPMITLNDLLGREGITKIDLLSMDIEGHEPKALAGFDIDRFRPELVVIEGKKGTVARYFRRHGYEQIQRYVPYDGVNRYFQRKRKP
jgi:FkbM family methyltransferase